MGHALKQKQGKKTSWMLWLTVSLTCKLAFSKPVIRNKEPMSSGILNTNQERKLENNVSIKPI